MKGLLSMLSVVLVLGLSTLGTTAEAAKRMGSGKSMGTQRQAAPEKPAAATPPTAAAAAAPATAAAAKSRSWMGPVAGLAAGLGLAALASHLGFGDELASLVMMGLLAAAVMVVVGLILRKRSATGQTDRGLSAGGLRPAHAHAGAAERSAGTPTQAASYRVAMPASGGSAIGAGLGSAMGAGVGAGVPATGRIPHDFDVAAFEGNAKLHFIRLQAAHGAGHLSEIQAFTTPEMFGEIKAELAHRGHAAQASEVVTLDARVLDVEEDTDRYLVSVRFVGALRHADHEPVEAFEEIWHLTKSRLGTDGWLLSGIQQAS